ncbi:hypothetical protein KVG29_02220 [Caldicoprobacter algeriensis]|nr:hypothetical protein [Caldicoprobacter algeriensis]
MSYRICHHIIRAQLRIEQKLDQLNKVFEKYPSIIAVVVFESYNTPYYNQNSNIDFGIIYDEDKSLKKVSLTF